MASNYPTPRKHVVVLAWDEQTATIGQVREDGVVDTMPWKHVADRLNTQAERIEELQEALSIAQERAVKRRRK